MLEFVGFMTAFLVVSALIVVAIASIALPLGWIWMLVDAILREDADYPGASANARLMWVLLMALLPVTAFAYFFLVYARAKRGASAESSANASHAQVTAPPPPATAVG